MSLTTSKASYRANFGPLMPQTFIAPYPYCLHCKARQAAPDGRDWYKVGCHAVPTLHARPGHLNIEGPGSHICAQLLRAVVLCPVCEDSGAVPSL